jgi:hypothetical membrane protein
MGRFKNVRNAAIVLLIAAGVYWLPEGGRAARTITGLIYIAFSIAIGYLGLRLYREHRVALHSLGDRYRAMLYGSVAVAVLALMARTRMWGTGLGELLWFVIIGGVVYALLSVIRHWRAY